MTTLGDLLILLDYSLGTSESRFFTQPIRIQAIRTALKKITMMYDLVEYIHEDTITFVNGVAEQPTACQRLNLLVDRTQNEYSLVDFETFKQRAPHSYTVKYDSATKKKYLHIYPAVSTTLYLTYIEECEDLEDSSDEMRLGDWWAEGVAEKACAILFRNARMYDVAADKEASAKKMLDDAYQNDRPGLQGRELTRLQSIFERKSMFSNAFYNNIPSVEVSQLTWITIDTATTASSQFGYFTNNATTRVVVTLPLLADIGDEIEIAGRGAAGWKLAQNAGQHIIFNSNTTTTGTGGYLESTLATDAVRLIYQASNEWHVIGSQGNITIV